MPLSVNNGHAILTDTVTVNERDLAPYVDHLRELPFVRDVQLTAGPPHRQPDALMKLRTPRRTFTLALEVKRTFLDRALTNAIIAGHLGLIENRDVPRLLAARYIPRPTGERLAEAGVNFVDRLGNIHLKLGDEYHVLVLGRREPAPEAAARRLGPALIQLFFVLLAEPTAAEWPVRKLANAAGIGKTAAATGRQRLIRTGVLARGRHATYRVIDRTRLADDFLTGYAQVLRPHLVVGRFRAPQREPEPFLKNVAVTAQQMAVNWAVTGGPAAHALDRFYQGGDVPLLVAPFTPALQRALRLINDREGPVTVLRGFGQHWAWRAVGDIIVAHPWLIYAELLHDGRPRALEAAALFRDAHLKT